MSWWISSDRSSTVEGDRFRMVIVPEGSSQSSEASVPEGSRQSSVAGRGLGRVPAREPARETTALRGEASVPIALRREARVSTAFRREPTATRREASPMGTVPWRDSWRDSQRGSWRVSQPSGGRLQPPGGRPALWVRARGGTHGVSHRGTHGVAPGLQLQERHCRQESGHTAGVTLQEGDHTAGDTLQEGGHTAGDTLQECGHNAEDTLHRDLEDRYAASVTPAGAESAEFVEYNEECTVLGRQVNLDMLASHNMLKLFKC